jgi:hypothetical protein
MLAILKVLLIIILIIVSSNFMGLSKILLIEFFHTHLFLINFFNFESLFSFNLMNIS